MRTTLLAALLLGACSTPPKVEAPSAPPPVAIVETEDANFEAVIVEAVPNAEDEGVSFTKVFVDGVEAGKTAVGPRSQEKRVRLKLSPGNQPVRLEHWVLPQVGEWTKLQDSLQPRERFVRVEEGSVARLSIRYGPGGPPVLTLSREPRR